MELPNQSDILIEFAFWCAEKISLNSLYSRDLFFFIRFGFGRVSLLMVIVDLKAEIILYEG